jgi:NADPH:quinone reductase-like Zn-dependent oxidoreductase
MLKAVRFSQFGGPEVLEIVDLPDPHPGPGQVRIAVRAAGVNPSDWKKRKGLMDGELPQTVGHEAARVSSSGFARSRPTAPTPRSTSPEAASCLSSSSSQAARSTS